MPSSSVAGSSRSTSPRDGAQSPTTAVVQSLDDVLFDLSAALERLASPSNMSVAHSKRGNHQAAPQHLAQLRSGLGPAAISGHGLEQQAHKDDCKWEEAVQHLSIMLSSAKLDVQLRAARSVAEIGQNNSVAREVICESKGLIAKLVRIMRDGGLEAITALSVLTTEHAPACDLAREAGAISILAAFINKEHRSVADDAIDLSLEIAHAETSSSDEARAHGERDSHHSSSMDIPIGSRAEVVVTLRNIATSNAKNRELIARENVIPQLVRLMTKTDRAVSASAIDHVEAAQQQEQEQQQKLGQVNVSELMSFVGTAAKTELPLFAESADPAEHKSRRKLSESAGQMLHTLILQGTKATKRLIIDSIIATVQQPGSVPPEEVPALMDILRESAEEQLTLVQGGSDAFALQSALQFGRWIRVPMTNLRGARNVFFKAQQRRDEERAERQRRLDLGFKPDRGFEEEAKEYFEQKRQQQQLVQHHQRQQKAQLHPVGEVIVKAHDETSRQATHKYPVPSTPTTSTGHGGKQSRASSSRSPPEHASDGQKLFDKLEAAAGSRSQRRHPGSRK